MLQTAAWPTPRGTAAPNGLLPVVSEALIGIRRAKTDAKASQKTPVTRAVIAGPALLVGGLLRHDVPRARQVARAIIRSRPDVTVLIDAQGRVRHRKMGATHFDELAAWARAKASGSRAASNLRISARQMPACARAKPGAPASACENAGQCDRALIHHTHPFFTARSKARALIFF